MEQILNVTLLVVRFWVVQYRLELILNVLCLLLGSGECNIDWN